MKTEEDRFTEITLVTFEGTGQATETKQIPLTGSQFSQALLDSLETRLKHLSGDLDLPLEGHLPGPRGEIAFRISSDFQNSFAFYYLEDEIIGLTLTLTGGESMPESEMIDSIRLLLLDHEDREDPDDDQIEGILASDDFDFQTFEQRPIHFFVRLAADAQETLDDLTHASLHLAKVLCQKKG